jgi:hypothetical protein
MRAGLAERGYLTNEQRLFLWSRPVPSLNWDANKTQSQQRGSLRHFRLLAPLIVKVPFVLDRCACQRGQVRFVATIQPRFSVRLRILHSNPLVCK